MAVLAKLGWKIMNDNNTPWVNLIKSKYKIPPNPRKWKKAKKGSPVWRAINKTRNILVKNTKWKVGNGDNISLWNDWWCNDIKSIGDHLNLNMTMDDTPVSSIINPSLNWNTSAIDHIIPTAIRENLSNIHLPTHHNSTDKPCWSKNTNGKFTINSCYNSIINQNPESNTINSVDWNWIWKLKLPARVTTFLWLIKQDKIMHNHACCTRGLSQDPSCRLCGGTETINHIFRSCEKAREVWNLILNSNDNSPGDINFFLWLDSNLKNQCNHNLSYWNSLFANILWFMWKARNEFQFNKKQITAATIIKQARDQTMNCIIAFSVPEKAATPDTHNRIKWNFPIAGSLKINTDGSCDPNDNKCGFGGIVRSSNGRWVEGFLGYLGCADPQRAELWAIWKALELCKERNWRHIAIESDCLELVDIINGGEIHENHPQGSLIEDCRVLKDEMSVFISHILREANKCANGLAKMGAQQSSSYVRLLIPPNEILEEMACDLRGREYGRGT